MKDKIESLDLLYTFMEKKSKQKGDNRRCTVVYRIIEIMHRQVCMIKQEKNRMTTLIKVD